MAFIRVPRRYRHGEREERLPRGSDPRGPLRGGPERSAKETQTPPQASHWRTCLGRRRKDVKGQRPTIVTVDGNGVERKWGPLSRASAWRVGSYWEDMGGDTKILLEKDGARKDVDVEKRVGKGGPRFWFKEKKLEPQQQPEEKRDDQPLQKRRPTSPRRKTTPSRKCRARG